MENELNMLVLELSQLEEMFKTYLAQPSPAETLTQEILSTLNNAMSIAKTSVLAAQQPPNTSDGTASGVRMMTKKRKTIPKLTTPKVVVKVGRVDGTDGALGHGYSWRKYGQKDIQNAKYPRCYYRCAHSETRNCQAKRRVQQCGENPTTLEVTYIHTHICCSSPQQHRLQDHEMQQCLCSDFIGEVSASDLAAPSLSFPTTPESFLHGDFVSEVSGSDYAVPSLSFPTTSESCQHRGLRREVSCSDLAATFLSYPATPKNCLHSGFVHGVSGLNQAAPSLPFPTTPESCPYSGFVHEVSCLYQAAPSLMFPTTPENCPYSGFVPEVSCLYQAAPSLLFPTAPESCQYSGFINKVSGTDLADPSLWLQTNPENYMDSSAGELLNEQLPGSLVFSETSGSNYSVSEGETRLC